MPIEIWERHKCIGFGVISFSYLYATKDNFNSLFEVKDGQHPKLLGLYMQKDVTIETLVILNNIFNFIKIWDKKISDDIIYPKVSRKIRKYGAFLNVNVDKYKQLTKETLLAD